MEGQPDAGSPAGRDAEDVPLVETAGASVIVNDPCEEVEVPLASPVAVASPIGADQSLERMRVHTKWASVLLLILSVSLAYEFPLVCIVALAGGGLASVWTWSSEAFLSGGDIRGSCNRDTSLAVHQATCLAAAALLVVALSVHVWYSLHEPTGRPVHDAVVAVLAAALLSVLLWNAFLARQLRAKLKPIVLAVLTGPE
eukprot:TRINITY_DN19603_c0_g1_i1.p1 TRINITY_DN19603_c0_g1~~TRINITY_DN19603_c0_g1_i1.p1  ORF type:complete len:199 (+),score=57.11 TRINITY_DN19603_c0_g1_i1:71-667(+)